MTIIDLLVKVSGPAADLTSFLNTAANKYPDLAPKARELSAALAEAVSLDNLTSLAAALPREIADIAQGKIKGKPHPGDLI
jgi:hypothetical protein